MTHSSPLRIVLVGFGPVGARFAEELLPAVASGEATLTVVGAERCDPYNRVMVAEFAVGDAEREELDLVDSASLIAAGVAVRTGSRVVGDRHGCTSACFWTTGFAPLRPPGAGDRGPSARPDARRSRADAALRRRPVSTTDSPPGVCVLRSVDDAQRVRDVVAAGGRVVVLGAGVLGIELGMLLAKAGAAPSIAHFGPIPMPRQLDRGSAAVLGAALEQAGLHVIPHTRAEAIVARTDDDGQRRFHALVSSDGRVTEGDLLVLSCGVVARTELAASAGLRVGGGILVDERLRAWTDPPHPCDRRLRAHRGSGAVSARGLGAGRPERAHRSRLATGGVAGPVAARRAAR